MNVKASCAPKENIQQDTVERRLKEVEAAMAELLTTSKVQWGMDEEEDESLPARILHAAKDNIHVSV